METIRIGNDIKLNIQVNNIDGVSSLNIKSVKCLIINTAPLEKYSHLSTSHNINKFCVPVYHAHPYIGFGLHPHWHYLYNILPKLAYTAPVSYQNTENSFEVLFPAKEQQFTGIYKLVLIIKIYQPGYINNVRTITMDYPDVFKLDDTSEADGNYNITVDFNKHTTSKGSTDFAVSKLTSLYMVGIEQLGLYSGTEDKITTSDTKYIPDVLSRGFVYVDGQEHPIAYTEESHRDILIPQQLVFDEEATDHNAALSRKIVGESVEIVSSEANSDTLQTIQLKTKDVKDQLEAYERNLLITTVTSQSDLLPYAFPIYVHNYAVDVFLGELGSVNNTESDSATTVNYGDSVKFDVGVIREDGSRLCMCNTRDCRKVPAVEIYVDTPYLNIQTVVDSEDDCKQYLTITNINDSGEDIEGNIKVVSKVSSGTDSKIEKTFKIFCKSLIVSES